MQPAPRDAALPRLEVEAKLRLRDRAGLERVLAALGARGGPALVQQDTFFAHPGRDFASTDEALRLRRTGDALELTYKGPRQAGGGPKARVEHNVPVAADPTALLEALGFRAVATVAKERTSYQLADGVEVALDRLAGLGDFAEVEAVGTDREAAAARVQQALRRLGLGDEPLLQESYLEMVLAQGRQARP